MTTPQTSRPTEAAWNPRQSGSAGATHGPALLVSHDDSHHGSPSTAGDTSRAGRCDYAHCTARRVWKSDGWLFCGMHYLEHRHLFHGARWPHNYGRYEPDVAARAKSDKLKPCGTAAAYRRHTRHGEDPCDQCRAANTRDVARRNAMREAS